MSGQIIALDHFAGTGWGVACHWLGIREYGVEKMPEAIRTRRAVGFRTIYRDVWSGLIHSWMVPWHRLYIASPPCQTFSVAGRGEGRKALDQVLRLIDAGVWKDPASLFDAGADLGDPRTALVLTPLAHIWAHRPELIALEQVPTALPVWEAIAHVLRGLGYSVWTGNMQAEQYGVPQTRKRAILIARADGIPARPPVPTHSRYYSRTPEKLDPGVLKWVSMADALGFGGFDLVGNQTPRGRTPGDYHSRPSSTPAQTLTGQARAWVLRSNYSSGSAGEAPEGNKLPRTERVADEPATTITSKAGSMQWIRRGLESRPSPTITGGGTDTGGAEPIAKLDRYVSSEDWVGDKTRLTIAEAAALQSYPKVLRPEIEAWKWRDAPATTIAGDPRITAREHHFHGEQAKTSLKLTRAEAVVLQSYPTPFPFQGNRGKQFLQIGNAVPPLMAAAILRELIAPAALAQSALDESASEWDEVFGVVAA